jgi:hypothetical protein
MMIFIPMDELYSSSYDFHHKLQFNHENFIGEETLFCIGGFKNLNTLIKLKNGKSITLRHLLESLPASAGMSRPQLFQQAEPNHGAMVTIVTSKLRIKIWSWHAKHSKRRGRKCLY